MGTCRVCGSRLPADKGGRMTEHNRFVNDNGAFHAAGSCSGVGRPCREKSESVARYRANRRRKLIEPFRVHAAVALDAIIEGRPYPDASILVRVALVDYKTHYPDQIHTVVAALRFVSAASTKAPVRVGDCYCTFCGVLCVRRVKKSWGENEVDRMRRMAANHEHPIVCALKHLAFSLVPAKPDVRRLPDEYLQEEAS